MQTSQPGVAFIAALEGVVTRAYRDVAGVWTIGVGHTAAAGDPKPKQGMTITHDEALAILARDLPRYEARVAAALSGVAQTAFDGAVSFDFNTGAIDKASWVAAYRGGDLATARQKLMLWTKAAGKAVAGLANRRQAEARLIFDRDYDAAMPTAASAAAAAAPATPSDSVKVWQADLATLGFYRGAVDGIAGPESTAAVLTYQKSHPDLVADGVVGPATRAAIARDVAARRSAGGIAGAAAAGVGAAGAGAGHAWLIAIAAGAAVLVVFGAFLAIRYADEWKRALNPKKET